MGWGAEPSAPHPTPPPRIELLGPATTPGRERSTGDTIGAENLGWAPNLIEGGDSGLVAEGDVVDTAIDAGPNNVGLVDQELLAITDNSAEVAEEGSWTANAALTLTTPTTVDAGDYSSTLTLSLFE